MSNAPASLGGAKEALGFCRQGQPPGSGATPLISMLRELAATDPRADVVWIHLSRTPDELPFTGDLSHLQAFMPNLTVAMAVSQPTPGWFGYRGRLTRRLLSAAAPDLARRDVFCCGPSGFMDEVKLIFAAEGGRKDAFHIEEFGPRALVAATEKTGEAVDAGPMHRLLIGERAIEVRGDETILQAALRQRAVIPYGCCQGMCGTCRVSLVEGEVTMQHNGGLSAEEEAQRYILACSSQPRSDVMIAL